MPKDLIILGSGGHCKVIIDIIEQINSKNKKYNLVGLIDNAEQTGVSSLLNYPILGKDDHLPRIKDHFPQIKAVIGIGDIGVRHKLAKLLDYYSIESVILEHPSFQKAINTAIGVGTVIMANTAINTDSNIGKHCIINTGATIDHDNIIGNFCNISPGCHLGGSVRIGHSTMLGIGVSVLPGSQIGSNTIIGAGSTVINDIPDNVTAVGSPARVIKVNENT